MESGRSADYHPPVELFSISRTITCLVFLAVCVTACSTVEIPPPTTVLSERQVIDLIRHPARWHRRSVTVTIYPYDFGSRQSDAGWSYVFCFDRCDRTVADRSTFLVHARSNRFDGFTGARAVTVYARFEDCITERVCADLWTGSLTELERPAE